MSGGDLSRTQSLGTQERGLAPDSTRPEVSCRLGPHTPAQWLCSGELLLRFMAGVMGVNSCSLWRWHPSTACTGTWSGSSGPALAVPLPMHSGQCAVAAMHGSQSNHSNDPADGLHLLIGMIVYVLPCLPLYLESFMKEGSTSAWLITFRATKDSTGCTLLKKAWHTHRTECK